MLVIALDEGGIFFEFGRIEGKGERALFDAYKKVRHALFLQPGGDGRIGPIFDFFGAKGQKYHSPALVKYLSEQSSQPQAPTLTENECALLKYLVDGWTDQKIASQLNVSSRTVRNDLRQLYDKLCVDCRLAAAVEALRRGLVW